MVLDLLAIGICHNIRLGGLVTLKKIILLFLVITSVFSFFIFYYKTDQEVFNKMAKAEESIARQLVIPDNLLLADPDEIYPMLCKSANKFKVNIFRTNFNYWEDNQVETLKYVLLTGNTRYFDAFRLKSGRLLTTRDTQKSNYFLSTSATRDHDQVGVIREFGSNHLVTIAPLKTSYKHFPVAGQYFVEASDKQAYEAFIKGFVEMLNEYY
jgi:putative ABC transport system permease protein